MSGIYALMDTLLPFEWLHYTFMKNALIAILLLTPLFGMLGTMAVDNKMAFFSDALGHSALTGIAIGVVLGWQEPDERDAAVRHSVGGAYHVCEASF